MSFHVKDDFRPGAPISQVPASWFNKVAQFLNNLVHGYGITLTKSEKGASVIEIDQTAIPSLSVISRETGTPADATNDNGSIATNVFDTTGDTLSWAAGGANGLMLDCYCRLNPQTAGGNYSVFQRCRLTFSKDGLLVSGVLMPDRIRIRTANS